MNIKPSIVNHPKFIALKSAVGDYAMEALIRIFGHCEEEQRGEFWAGKSPEYLEIVSRWSGESHLLWDALNLIGFASQEDGGIRIHQWNEHNSMLLNAWNSWKKRHLKNQNSPDSHLTVTRESPANSPDRHASLSPSLLREKERESKEEEGLSPGIEVPSDAEVFAFIEQWPGEPASATPTVPKDWAIQWLARMAGRREWPADWRRKLTADWRAGFRAWVQGEKNCAPEKSKKRDAWQVQKDLEAVREQISTHPCTSWPGNKPRDPKIEAQFQALVQRRRDLEKELAHV